VERSPKISVISPCYNHGKYINEMLESIFNQTFADYEVILVNDGSTDDTREILERITHDKVKIIHTGNKGPSHARNLAVEHASAPIILNVDADDKIASTFLEKAFDLFNSDPGIGIIYCDVEFFGDRSGKFVLEDYSVENMLNDNRIVAQAFFRKEDWLLAGGYSHELIYTAEDWDFWLSIIELGRKVVKIPEPLVYYRTYKNPEESRSGRMKRDRIKVVNTLLTIFHRHEGLYNAYPLARDRVLGIERKFNNESMLERKLKNYYFRYFGSE
jgi:glycosyltransferase involved in cell wall biosynthesis